VHKFPALQRAVNRRLASFISAEANRSKAKCSSLGNLLPLLSVSDKYRWADIAVPYLSETFDRNVLWACKAHPELAQTSGPNGEKESAGQEGNRLRKTFEATTVSLRLALFHVYMLTTVCKGDSSARANRYDRFFGHPEPEALVEPAPAAAPAPPAAGEASDAKPLAAAVAEAPALTPLSFAAFKKAIGSIKQCGQWRDFFRMAQVRVDPSLLAEWLRRSVRNSLRKRYHKKGMDFRRVHASGVSKILKQGQSYSTEGQLDHVEFRDTWSWAGQRRYLDATVQLYDKHHKQRCYLDYSHTRDMSFPAVTHSGDVMGASSGTHTIRIRLSQLPEDITQLVFVLSAWTGTFRDIVKPSVSFVATGATQGGAGEEEKRVEEDRTLCQYNLEAHNKADDKTAVVMCKLFRVPGKQGWHVLAVGTPCKGKAGDYSRINKVVETIL